MDSLDLILAAAARTLHARRARALAERKNAAYVALIASMSPADLLPGAVDALQAARAGGCGRGLASASKNAAAVLARLGIAEASTMWSMPS